MRDCWLPWCIELIYMPTFWPSPNFSFCCFVRRSHLGQKKRKKKETDCPPVQISNSVHCKRKHSAHLGCYFNPIPACFLVLNKPGGGGGGRRKPHIEVRFKWMWFPIETFHSRNFSLRDGNSRRSSMPLRQEVFCSSLYYQSLDGEAWHRSDDFRGRKGDRRYRRMSAVCCLQRRVEQRKLLKLQSLTADKTNPRQKQRIWLERSASSPAQRSTSACAILFGVANKVHTHLEPTSICRRKTLFPFSESIQVKFFWTLFKKSPDTNLVSTENMDNDFSSLKPAPSRARYFPRDMLLLTTTAREMVWFLLLNNWPQIGRFDEDSRGFPDSCGWHQVGATLLAYPVS